MAIKLRVKKRVWNKSTGRDYSKEAAYDASPARKRKRALRNKARAKLMKKGIVRVGDGKDVDHRDNNQANNNLSNLRAVPASKNRSYDRDKRRKLIRNRP